MNDPTPVYVIIEGVPGSPAAAPFSLQFVRVPYDVEAELTVARAMGLPEFDGYASELRHSLYRGELKTGKPPRYHRRSPDAAAS